MNERPTEKALLIEYQTCEQGVNTNVMAFWTIAAIFIGISTALLGALVFAIFTTDLLGDFIKTRTLQTTANVWALRLIGSGISLVVISILCVLRCWLRRVNYLNDRYRERMREIEKRMKLCTSRIIHAVDNWKTLLKVEKQHLVECKSEDWFEKMSKQAPAAGRRRRYFDVIIYITIGLWVALLLAIWFLPCFISWLGVLVVE